MGFMRFLDKYQVGFLVVYVVLFNVIGVLCLSYLYTTQNH